MHAQKDSTHASMHCPLEWLKLSGNGLIVQSSQPCRDQVEEVSLPPTRAHNAVSGAFRLLSYEV